MPYWVERPTDEFGDPAALDTPMRQPKAINECRLPFPDQVIDYRSGPEYLADTETGETTLEDEKAVKLFADEDGKGGIPITVDKRLRGKQRRKGKRRKRK